MNRGHSSTYSDPALEGPRLSELGFWNDRYFKLRRLLIIERLTDKDLPFYASRISMDLFLLALGFAFFMRVGNNWLQLVTATYLAFVFTQLGFIVHDSGHQQIFQETRKNRAIGIIFANVLLGFSWAWWVTTHNRHHGNPNQPGLDPDVEFIALAFSKEQAMKKRGVFRFIAR